MTPPRCEAPPGSEPDGALRNSFGDEHTADQQEAQGHACLRVPFRIRNSFPASLRSSSSRLPLARERGLVSGRT